MSSATLLVRSIRPLAVLRAAALVVLGVLLVGPQLFAERTHRDPVRTRDLTRTPGDMRPVDDTSKDPSTGAFAVLAAAVPGPNGPFRLESESVTLLLDAFGSFGTSTSGGAATFDDGTRRASTVYESMAHVRGVGFLDGDSQLLPQSAAHAHQDGSAVVASYRLGPWQVDLRSELSDCEEPHCAVLEQRWTLTNAGTVPADLAVTLYLDGDLFFSGAYANDFGALAGDVLYQFDEGSDPLAPSTYLGLESDAPAALSVAREVGEFSEQRRRISHGGLLVPGVLRRGTGANADADADGITDTGYDVTLGAQTDFGTLAPGESVELVGRTRWGLGRLVDLGSEPEPITADAGGDRLVECEGAEGTVVRLDASGSSPLADLVRFDWSVDGAPAGEGATLDVVLQPGPHLVSLLVADAAGHSDEDQAVVEVADTVAPATLVLGPVVLWPPDHRLVPVRLPVAVHDDCSDDIALQVLSVTSDEPDEVGAGGDGMTAGDARVDADGTLWLRRERQGDGDGRVYRVLAAAVDGAGNRTPFFAEVRVPHSQAAPAQDSGVAERLFP